MSFGIAVAFGGPFQEALLASDGRAMLGDEVFADDHPKIFAIAEDRGLMVMGDELLRDRILSQFTPRACGLSLEEAVELLISVAKAEKSKSPDMNCDFVLAGRGNDGWVKMAAFSTKEKHNPRTGEDLEPFKVTDYDPGEGFRLVLLPGPGIEEHDELNLAKELTWELSHISSPDQAVEIAVRAIEKASSLSEAAFVGGEIFIWRLSRGVQKEGF